MQITYLGHAGFCVETDASIIIMDPWLSDQGAFDASWFQYPKNHHMGDFVQQILATSKKDKYIYISHEHRDHFDIPFLQSLKNRDFTLLLANYSHPLVKIELEAIQYQCHEIILLNDNEAFSLADGELRLFIIDTELNCDSAMLIKNGPHSFLDMNDCKIHDRLQAIVAEHGDIEILTAQFSGASWHPTCYQMSADQYREICEHKIHSKFAATAQAIKQVNAKIYLPSAGPPCFLDPLLLPINFQPINTYPRAAELLAYLDEHHAVMKKHTQWMAVFPGDTLNVDTYQLSDQSATAVDDKNFKTYVQAYAKAYQPLFAQRARDNQEINPQQVFKLLEIELKKKIRALTAVNQQVKTLLYWRLNEMPEQMFCIDLANKTLKVCESIQDLNNYCRISTPAWQINKVLNGSMTWPDFALALRVTLERVPDVYNTVLHGFLILDADKIHSFCKKMANIEKKQERIIIEAEGKRYSVARYCPHQGGDLSQGHLEGSCWVCPVHQWRFDLSKQGQCTHNTSTIDSVCLGPIKK